MSCTACTELDSLHSEYVYVWEGRGRGALMFCEHPIFILWIERFKQEKYYSSVLDERWRFLILQKQIV